MGTLGDDAAKRGTSAGCSPRQQAILAYMASHLRLHGVPPTLREMAQAVGIASTNGIVTHLRTLQRLGRVEQLPHKARGWRLCAANPSPPSTAASNGGRARRRGLAAAAKHNGTVATAHRAAVPVPLLGEVAAGDLSLAVQQAEQTLQIDPQMLPRQHGELFALRIVGRSMVDAGIAPHDIVVVERCQRAEAGQIVVAALGDEATVKRFVPRPQSNEVHLEPANATMAPIVLPAHRAHELRILGVVLGVWRNL